MLQYDATKMPILATPAAETIARFAPVHMVAMVEGAHARSEDDKLRVHLAGLLLAFRGFVHRCEVALRRLEGETLAVDSAITADDADEKVDLEIGMRGHIVDWIRACVVLANDSAAMYREILEPFAGRTLDDVAKGMQECVDMAEESARRLRYALEAFEG
jgi:hypothetical protein